MKLSNIKTQDQIWKQVSYINPVQDIHDMIRRYIFKRITDQILDQIKDQVLYQIEDQIVYNCIIHIWDQLEDKFNIKSEL